MQPQLFLLTAILRLGGWADGMLGDGAGTPLLAPRPGPEEVRAHMDQTVARKVSREGARYDLVPHTISVLE
jgi:hypothetical protein